MSEPEDGMKPYVFPLAILIAKGSVIFIVSSITLLIDGRLDQWVGNVVWYVGGTTW